MLKVLWEIGRLKEGIGGKGSSRISATHKGDARRSVFLLPVEKTKLLLFRRVAKRVRRHGGSSRNSDNDKGDAQGSVVSLLVESKKFFTFN